MGFWTCSGTALSCKSSNDPEANIIYRNSDPEFLKLHCRGCSEKECCIGVGGGVEPPRMVYPVRPFTTLISKGDCEGY